ncbi:MAG: GntR family transcriptional regulator [Thiothrix sp.]|nr:GntR family transcriptional regulator [Thiothrix sp.]HPE59544.1 GntR family transcriptional regulator [Thiolinea sp.]
MAGTDPLRPTAEPIYDALKEAILRGELVPGDPLRQDEIARSHGVSKIPVREALLRLEVDGYVLFRKNRGAMVREISAQDILNAMDIRVALECKALELAIPNMVSADLEAARRILDACEGAEPRHWCKMVARFHATLYAPCDNPELLLMISGLRERLGAFTAAFFPDRAGLTRPQQDYAEILRSCEKGDVEQGVALLAKHIQTTKKETAARLRRAGRPG